MHSYFSKNILEDFLFICCSLIYYKLKFYAKQMFCVKLSEKKLLLLIFRKLNSKSSCRLLQHKFCKSYLNVGLIGGKLL